MLKRMVNFHWQFRNTKRNLLESRSTKTFFTGFSFGKTVSSWDIFVNLKQKVQPKDSHNFQLWYMFYTIFVVTKVYLATLKLLICLLENGVKDNNDHGRSSKKIDQLFHDGGLCHIETSLLICRALANIFDIIFPVCMSCYLFLKIKVNLLV